MIAYLTATQAVVPETNPSTRTWRHGHRSGFVSDQNRPLLNLFYPGAAPGLTAASQRGTRLAAVLPARLGEAVQSSSVAFGERSSWVQLTRGSSSRRWKSGATACPTVQRIAPLFTSAQRAAFGRIKQQNVGPQPRAFSLAWRSIGSQATAYRMRDASQSFGCSHSPRLGQTCRTEKGNEWGGGGKPIQ